MNIPMIYAGWGYIILFLFMFANMIWNSKTKGDKIFSIFMFGFWCVFTGFTICFLLYQHSNQ